MIAYLAAALAASIVGNIIMVLREAKHVKILGHMAEINRQLTARLESYQAEDTYVVADVEVPR